MNKSELIDALAARFEGNRKAAAHALDSVLDTITREVARGEKVAITGFGSFERRVREARLVRNPRTGESLMADPTAIAKFIPGANLKSVVAGLRDLPALALDTATAAIPGVKGTQTSASSRGSVKSAAAPAEADAGVARDVAATTTAEKAGAPATRATAKKTTAKKATPKKAGAKKTTAKKTAAPADTARATAAATTAKKTAKKSTATKAAANKSGAKKSGAKKSTAKKTTAKKTTAKKTTAKKSTAKKAAGSGVPAASTKPLDQTSTAKKAAARQPDGETDRKAAGEPTAS